MKKAKTIISVFLFIWGGQISAQSNTVASGGDATGSGGHISFSIGQIDYIPQSNANYYILLGVQQPDGITSLPVKLIDFTATLTKGAVRLNWSTASEINNHYFDIERASNGILFEKLGMVNSKGNGNTKEDYVFTDLKPLDGHSFYRLKQVDNDGDIAYSDVRSIDFNPIDNPLLKIFPNPIQETLNVRVFSDREADYTMTIYTLNGQKVGSKAVHYNKGNNLIQWDLPFIAKGAYILNAGIGNGMQAKFIK